MKTPRGKGPELSEADLKKVAGGVGRKKIVRKRATTGVELTETELQSASGGIRVNLPKRKP